MDPLRFYPPGEHPAADRYREHMAKLEALRDMRPLGRSPDIDAAIAHCQQQIDAVEIGEQMRKAYHHEKSSHTATIDPESPQS